MEEREDGEGEGGDKNGHAPQKRKNLNPASKKQDGPTKKPKKEAKRDNPEAELSVIRIRNKGEKWVDAHTTFVQGGKDLATIENEKEVDMDVTWEIVQWDAVREEISKKMLETETKIIDDETRDKYEKETSEMWDQFYSVNKQKFFKDRSYISKEISELSGVGSIKGPNPVVLEAGCGVGNSLIPLLRINTDKFFYAFDCSETAVKLLKAHEEYDPKRCEAFVLDMTTQDIYPHIPEDKVDVATLIFVLSAVPPTQMKTVLQRIHKVLKPGGMVIIRDYGIYDLTQMRFFAKKTPNKMGENFYRRGDGTFSYFFEKDKADALFIEAGFSVVESKYDTRVLQNRKRKLKMYRVWFTGKYIKQS